MYKLLRKFSSSIILLCFCTGCAFAEKPTSWSGNIYKIINKFNVQHQDFVSKTCTPGVEAKYFKLLKDYRGQGYYLPKLNNDVDKNAIRKNLKHFSKKSNYIKKLIIKLKKNKRFPRHADIEKRIMISVDKLLDFKKIFYTTKSNVEKEVALKESKKEIIKFRKILTENLNDIFFLKSYNFPNDYLSYRRDYEAFKDLKGTKNIKKANEVFFFRKLVEDGAFDADKTRPDKYLRTTLDTLYLNVKKMNSFLSEDVRYDLEWTLRKIKYILKRGKRKQLERLTEWRERTDQSLSFYKELLSIKNKNKTKFLVKKENEAADKLKSFVYQKEADVYAYWAKQSELNKFLFSLETILVNEVGVIDGKTGIERSAVAQVVFNRYYDDFYNQLDPKQLLYDKIPKSIDKSREKWLNVLFRVGEFSFTYHYIPAVSEIFCPDMSKRGKLIRNKNLKIALKTSENYDSSFPAFRYFSRISMVGKIDMSTVWTNYRRLPELVGHKVIKQRKLLNLYKRNKYKFFYIFRDHKKREHTVVKIQDKVYSFRKENGKNVFYSYRNPHLFAYFVKK